MILKIFFMQISFLHNVLWSILLPSLILCVNKNLGQCLENKCENWISARCLPGGQEIFSDCSVPYKVVHLSFVLKGMVKENPKKNLEKLRRGGNFRCLFNNTKLNLERRILHRILRKIDICIKNIFNIKF